MSDVERFLKSEGMQDSANAAPPLFEIYRTLKGSVACTVLHKPGTFDPVPVRFQAIEGLVTEDGHEIGRAVAPSLVTNPDVVPNRSYNNDLASITGRVNKVLNQVCPPDRYIGYASAFIGEWIKAPAGVPLEIAEVVELQDRPAQRGRSAQVLSWISSVNPVEVRSFMKGESYGKVTDPRNISTVGAEHTLRLSAYTYAFKRDILYPMDWYAPGKTPHQIASRVVQIASEFSLAETDYSRFDGTISLWLRQNVERAAYLRWVSPEHREDLGLLLEAEMNPRGRTSNGLPYEPCASRLSGSPLTTDGNTLINAFVTYCAAREGKMSHEHALRMLGIYAGDDGLSMVKGSYLRDAARDLGLTLKYEWRTSGSFSFLGRIFYGADVGELGSIQDPLRTWRKLHISFAPAYISDTQALANRAAGYRSLDPEAPVLKEWCEKVLEFTGLYGALDSDAPYYARMAERDPEFGTWPQLTTEAGLEAIAWRIGSTVESVADLCQRIRDARQLSDLEYLWESPPLEVTITAAVDGAVQEAPKTTKSHTSKPFSRRENRRLGKPGKAERPRIPRVPRGASRK